MLSNIQRISDITIPSMFAINLIECMLSLKLMICMSVCTLPEILHHAATVLYSSFTILYSKSSQFYLLPSVLKT